MIQGTVSGNLVPAIRLTLIGADHREIEIEAEAKSTIGTALMAGNEVRIQLRPGGIVTIEDMTPGVLTIADHNMKSPSASKPVIGLVGGMGSGKSRVASAFARHGGHIVAADMFGHEALAQPDVLPRIVQRWGDRVLDGKGAVDRKKLGAIVFASPVERANLELLVFPWIEKRIREVLETARSDPKTPFVVLDAAIMLEAGWNNTCDRIVYVHAPRPVRLERLQTQRGLSADDVGRREAVQAPLSIKASRADAAVDNSGPADETEKQVDAIVIRWVLT